MGRGNNGRIEDLKRHLFKMADIRRENSDQLKANTKPQIEVKKILTSK